MFVSGPLLGWLPSQVVIGRFAWLKCAVPRTGGLRFRFWLDCLNAPSADGLRSSETGWGRRRHFEDLRNGRPNANTFLA